MQQSEWNIQKTLKVLSKDFFLKFYRYICKIKDKR